MNLSAKHKKIFLTLFLAFALVGCGSLTLAPAAWSAPAATTAPKTATAPKWFRLVPECATDKGTPGSPPPVPSLVCALQTFGNISQIILGITGSFALLMFVYGGFLLVTSAGSQEKVSQGKKAITNAVIGIMIIMTSGLLIQYGLGKLELSSDFLSVGARCSSDKVADAEGSGVFVQLPNGTIVCKKIGECKTLERYACEIVSAGGTGAGKYCIPNLCASGACGGKDKDRDCMCCYTPPAPKPTK